MCVCVCIQMCSFQQLGNASIREVFLQLVALKRAVYYYPATVPIGPEQAPAPYPLLHGFFGCKHLYWKTHPTHFNAENWGTIYLWNVSNTSHMQQQNERQQLDSYYPVVFSIIFVFIFKMFSILNTLFLVMFKIVLNPVGFSVLSKIQPV